MAELAKVLEFLAAAFPPEEVDFKVQSFSKDRKRGLAVPYVDARTVQSRLDEAVRAGLLRDWEPSFRILEARPPEGEKEAYYAVECVLTLRGQEGEYRRADVGEGDSLKAAYSDALKRAAVHFGVARYLYGTAKEWVDLKEGGAIPEEAVRRLRARLGGGKPGQGQEAKPQPQGEEDRLKRADEAIARLVGELKAAGLGKEAAEVLAKFGYKIGDPGQGPEALEQAKKVYKALEAFQGHKGK